ncbi:hypothetical protein N7453_006705 [Penicillium expansum]|nr:hypothetical protein N7453_006705 [Penicillium expansum]
MKGASDKNMVSQDVAVEATDQDDWDMQRLGKTQQFKRNFRFYSILGFTTTLMATWESILLTSTYGLTDGGRAGMVYVYIGSFVGFFAAVISMAEIASMRLLLVFATFAVTLIQGLLVFNYSDPSGWVYGFERWHGTLLTIAIAAVGTVVNTWGYKILPPMEGLILAIHLFGFVVVVVLMWAMSPGKASGESVWKEFTNSGEWPSMGLACLVGQLTPIFSWTGPDAATHMSEEVQNAALVVPWCMVSTALINGALGFIMLITLLYKMGDLQDVLAPASGFSFLPAVNHATGSVAATNAVAAIILVMEVCSAIGILATVSRQTFAFARDDALPFSKHLAHVNRRTQIPICSVLVSTIITVLLSLINIGSTAAFNAVASVMIAALFTTYILPIAAVIRVRFQPGGIPPSRFSLGIFGLAINVFSLAWLCFAIIFTFFPTANNPTPVNMNWSILVFGAVVIFAIVLYIVHGRRVYRSPVTQVRKVE